MSLNLQATEDKNSAIAQADKTATKAKLADRLINGLAGEFKRWSDAIHQFAIAESETPLPLPVCPVEDSSQLIPPYLHAIYPLIVIAWESMAVGFCLNHAWHSQELTVSSWENMALAPMF